MKKLMTIAAVLSFSASTMAATIEELNSIPTKDVTLENAEAVFDAAVATTNTGRIISLVTHGKVSLEDAVHKTMSKKPFKMCVAAFHGAGSTTNHALVAEALAGLNYADFDNKTFGDVKTVAMRHKFQLTDAGQAEVARMYQANPLFGAEIYCSCAYDTSMQRAFAAKAEEAYRATKHLVKSCGSPRMAGIFWRYNYFAKDYAFFSAMYDKSLVNVNNFWLYPTGRPEYLQLMKDTLEKYKTMKPSASTDERITYFARAIDKIDGTKNATFNSIDFLSSTKTKLAATIYCNNVDKLLEVLIACDDSLEAKDVDAALWPINSLDPDYKKAEVLKALKAINQRYTLKLYDDHDTWEPVISKIRAMIDCRQ